MDYHDSSAGNARLAVIKLAATANKLGTVFFNPGSSLPPSFVVFHRHPFLQADPEAQESKPCQHFLRCLVDTSWVPLT
jgi:hypothetical protein